MGTGLPHPDLPGRQPGVLLLTHPWFQALPWLLAGGLSATLSLAAWFLPGPPEPPLPPPPLPRRATADELQLLARQQATLQADLSEAVARLGRAPTLPELESVAPDGRPMLAHGIPDNPLRPGVSWVQDRCPARSQVEDGADWIYCAEEARFEAVGTAD